jgi:predicted dehydrogenase
MPDSKIGIVGLGNHGRLLMDYLASAEVEIVGIDASDRLRERFASDYGVKTCENYAVLEEQEVDGAIVTVPNNLHEEVAIQALGYNCDVLIEKPIATSVAAIERISDVLAASEGACIVDLYHRHVPEVRLLQSVLSSGDIGNIEHVHARFTRRQGVPAHGSWLTSKEIAGGGVLMDLGVHVIDLLLWLLEFPSVEYVSGALKGYNKQYEWTELEEYVPERDLGADLYDVENTAILTLRSDSGTMMNIETAWANGESTQHQYRIHGTEGAAVLDISNLGGAPELQIKQTSSDPVDHFVDRSLTTPHTPNPQRQLLQHFLEIVRGREEPRQTFDDYLAVHELIEETYSREE